MFVYTRVASRIMHNEQGGHPLFVDNGCPPPPPPPVHCALILAPYAIQF